MWNIRVSKLKGKFIPKYYKLIVFKEVKNLRQQSMLVRENTKENFKLNIKSSHI